MTNGINKANSLLPKIRKIPFWQLGLPFAGPFNTIIKVLYFVLYDFWGGYMCDYRVTASYKAGNDETLLT